MDDRRRSGLRRQATPAIIIQDDRFDETASVVVCPLTSDDVDASYLRIPFDPTPDNGLHRSSRVMIDKVTSLSRTRLGHRIGRLADAEMGEVERALLVFLGLA